MAQLITLLSIYPSTNHLAKDLSQSR
jgi:hypothetical protein